MLFGDAYDISTTFFLRYVDEKKIDLGPCFALLMCGYGVCSTCMPKLNG